MEKGCLTHPRGVELLWKFVEAALEQNLKQKVRVVIPHQHPRS
jgi:hypothetical protein